MPTNQEQSGTLTAGTPVGGKAASATAPDTRPPTGPGLRAIWPQTCTDRDGRLWTWDREIGCYSHDGPDGPILRTRELLRDVHGPLTSPACAGHPNDPAERYLNLKDRSTSGAGNAFEWVLEHSRATGLAKHVLLNLAFEVDGDVDNEPTIGNPPWPGYLHLWLLVDDGSYASMAPFTESDLDPIAEAVMELIALGELLLITEQVDPSSMDLARSCPGVEYTLPTYRAWTVRELAW